MITDIQKFSIHDGPGIRTVVFFKGCPLGCLWCQNPETRKTSFQLMLNPQLCIGCGSCKKVCPSGAAYGEWMNCKSCGLCVDECYAKARRIAGSIFTADQVFEKVREDEVFYKNSKGGVTASGGEPMLQAKFCRELFEKCKTAGISTAIETSGYCTYDNFELLLPWCDLFLYDIKHTDTKLHKKYTGHGNGRILYNLKKITKAGANVIIRMPFIPGVNDMAWNLRKMAQTAAECRIREIHLLPFHQFGESKWKELSLEYKCHDYLPPTEEALHEGAAILKEYGLRVNIGGYGEGQRRSTDGKD